MGKPILCLDFDGVIHSYTSGWKGADVIPDPPVPGALEFMKAALEHFDVAVFSSRSNQPGGIAAMKDWLIQNDRADEEHPTGTGVWEAVLDGVIRFPLEKPAAFVTIDDRAITFDGTWPKLNVLLSFKPWNEK